jgi:ribonuclease R
MEFLELETNHEIKNHSREIRSEAEIIRNQLLEWLFIDESPNRLQVEWITIDKAMSKDLDDGIWAEETENGYAIFVSIADVAEIVKPDSILDLDAMNRSTSVYTSHYAYHMFPSEISTDICSLNNETNRLTLTTRICLDKNFWVVDSKIFESRFYNKKRFNYQDFNEQFNNYWEEYYKELNLFHHIAKWLYNKRIWKWAHPDFKEHVGLKVWKEEINSTNTASFVVQEFMITANIENTKINFKEKINWVFRLHMPDLKWKIVWKTDIQRAFYNYRRWYHYWLWEDFYWHFTSPIRRYSDLINHRQQKAWLRNDKEVYSINEIRKLIIFINSRIEDTLKLEQHYNKEIFNKKVERFIKKLQETNYETISSISNEKFSKMIFFFLTNPEYFDEERIYEEIMYRIENNLLSSKVIGQLRSMPNEITQSISFKELIDEKTKTK